MPGPDLRHLGPQDAVVAFRSYPRRYAGEFDEIERGGIARDDAVDDVAARLGPEGVSAIQIASDVTRTWSVLSGALTQVLRHDDAVLHPAIVDATLRHWDNPPPGTVADALALLGHEADALADQIVGVLSTDDWSRSAVVAGGGSVTALDVVKDAVGVGADGLARIRATLTAVRR
jgi:hypothetical protein